MGDGVDDFRLTELHDRNIDFQLRRRHRQPLALRRLVSFFLKANLPEALWNEPLVFTFGIGVLRILLVIIPCIPHDIFLYLFAKHILMRILVIDNCFYSFHPVVFYALVYESGWVNVRLQIRENRFYLNR